jgi:hypothetical protein
MTSANFSILPQSAIEQAFQTPLKIVKETSLCALQNKKPRVFDDIVSYTLNPFKLASKPALVANSDSLSENALYWETLVLVGGNICSEVVIYHCEGVSYLAYLNILPPDFGLFSALAPKQAIQFVDKLISMTIVNMSSNTKLRGGMNITTTLYNPNLARIFVAQGFKEDPNGAQIVGLPLPAYFYKPLR